MPMKSKTKLVKVLLTNIMIAFAISLVASYIAIGQAGVPAEAVDAVRLPIGEDILAVTPAEIAVSIAAQLIRCRAELRPTRPHRPTS